MKTTIQYSLVICVLVVCCLACNNNKPAAENLSKTTQIAAEINLDSIFYQDHAINNDSAHNELERYKDYIDQARIDLKKFDPVKYKNVDSILRYGAYIERSELGEMLALSSSNDSVFVLTGMKYKQDKNQEYYLEQDIIYALKATSGINNTITWRYFDFTQPCPAACPDIGIYPLK